MVTLTKEGRDLLESHRRNQDAPDRQTFTHGVQRPRELKHDAELYRAYLEEAEHLHDAGATIHRVVLENELKAEYQTFLREPNRDRDDSDGRDDVRDVEVMTPHYRGAHAAGKSGSGFSLYFSGRGGGGGGRGGSRSRGYMEESL